MKRQEQLLRVQARVKGFLRGASVRGLAFGQVLKLTHASDCIASYHSYTFLRCKDLFAKNASRYCLHEFSPKGCQWQIVIPYKIHNLKCKCTASLPAEEIRALGSKEQPTLNLNEVKQRVQVYHKKDGSAFEVFCLVPGLQMEDLRYIAHEHSLTHSACFLEEIMEASQEVPKSN